jgi:hypothetical protein
VAVPYGIGDSAIGVDCGTNQKECPMPEKSPQKPAGKKPGKSLKEKREAKKEKKDSRSSLGR